MSDTTSIWDGFRDGWGAFTGLNGWLNPTTSTTPGIDAQTQQQARAALLMNLGAPLIAASQRGLSPAARSAAFMQMGQAGQAYQQALTGGQDRALRAAQLDRFRREEAADAALWGSIDGAAAPAPTTGPASLPPVQPRLPAGVGGAVTAQPLADPNGGPSAGALEPRSVAALPDAGRTTYTPPQGVDRNVDLLARTIIGEAGNQSAEGQSAVAHVVLNRARLAGMSPEQVVLASNQFEPWNTEAGRARLLSISPTSPEYQQAVRIAQDAVAGRSNDPTRGATHFYSPGAQAALQRPTPAWAQGESQDIGDHRFYRLGYSAPQGGARLVSLDGAALPTGTGAATPTGGAGAAGPAPATGQRPIWEQLNIPQDTFMAIRMLPREQRTQVLGQIIASRVTRQPQQPFGSAEGGYYRMDPSGQAVMVVPPTRQGLQPDQILTTENNIRGQFLALPEVRQFAQAQTAFNTLRNTADDPTGDLARIFTFFKALDPSGVVQPSDLATFARSRGASESVVSNLSRLLGNGTLTPEARREIMDFAERQYESAHGEYTHSLDRFGAIVDAIPGASRVRVLPDARSPALTADIEARRSALRATPNQIADMDIGAVGGLSRFADRLGAEQRAAAGTRLTQLLPVERINSMSPEELTALRSLVPMMSLETRSAVQARIAALSPQAPGAQPAAPVQRDIPDQPPMSDAQRAQFQRRFPASTISRMAAPEIATLRGRWADLTEEQRQAVGAREAALAAPPPPPAPARTREQRFSDRFSASAIGSMSAAEVRALRARAALLTQEQRDALAAREAELAR